MPSRELQVDILAPHSSPLKSMSELRDWSPSQETFNIPNVPLQPRVKNEERPRLILTHDMAGGYKEDSQIQGNLYQQIYYLQYWHLTDIFIYFSHERVSIPPVNWTNVCHRNGVQCLGTLIIEGTEQMHEMEALLHGPPLANPPDNDPMRLWSPFYADKLIAVAKHYGFDGWLINIECEFFPFPTPPQFKAKELAKFLNYLTTKIHEEIPGSKIIWYDSMTTSGEIHWQNDLNIHNELFFKNSDGIFINYWWQKEYPEMARRVAERHGRSGLDVYFGTDVWGRGTYGGGEFKSYKGVETAAEARASSALFAMAWTYEHFDKADFEKMDRLFWLGGDHSEFPPLPPKAHSDDSDDSDDELSHGHRKGIADTLPIFPVPGETWFATNFDRGFGTRFYHQGKKLLCQPWSHLSHQSILPNLQYRSPTLYPPDKNIQVKCELKSDYGAFSGGTSLVLTGQRLTHRETRDLEVDVIIPLYALELDASQGCTLKYTYRTLLTDDVRLLMACNFELQTLNSNDTEGCFTSWLPDLNFDRDDGFRATVSTTDGSSSRCFLIPAADESTGENDWITKTVHILPLQEEGSKLIIKRVEIHVVANTAGLVGVNPHVIACLGQLSIIPNTIATEPEQEVKLIELKWQDAHTDKETSRFFGTLGWLDLSKTQYGWRETDYYIISHEVNGEKEFIGTAFCNQYRISGIELKDKSHRIVVEAVDREGNIFSTAKLNLIL